jgi:hypothetical protein
MADTHSIQKEKKIMMIFFIDDLITDRRNYFIWLAFKCNLVARIIMTNVESPTRF